MTLPEIKSLCRRYDIAPTKRLGQHFLVHERSLARIVNAAHLESGDEVLEVGPGLGLLTALLCRRARHVTAVEKDRQFSGPFAEVLAGQPNITVVFDDIRKWWRENASAWNGRPFKVVANLPYHIASHLLELFTAGSVHPTDATLLVQREVAQRAVAAPGQTSLLSLAVQLYCRPSIAGIVPAAHFWPAPRVESAILHLAAIGEGVPDVLPDRFFAVARAGFANRRKQLVGNVLRLSDVNRSELVTLFDRLGIGKHARAQELTMTQWVGLAQEIGEKIGNSSVSNHPRDPLG